MFFIRRLPLIFSLGILLASPLRGAESPAPTTVAEFGVVTLDISRAQAFSDFISEKKTIKNIQKSTAKGAMRFREGASGIYHVRTLANGKPTDDQGRFETIVTISIPRPDGTLRFTATGEERWRVPANVPEIWPRHDDPCEPIFRGPNAREKRKKWRSKRFHRDVEKERRQRQAREDYRRRAIGEAFRESLDAARDEAEMQLQKSLQGGAVSPTPTSENK